MRWRTTSPPTRRRRRIRGRRRRRRHRSARGRPRSPPRRARRRCRWHRRRARFLADRVAAEGDDALGAETSRREDGAEADGAVADHRDAVAALHPGADRRVVAGAHDVGQREQRPQHLVRVARARDPHERAGGERYADRLALAAVRLAVAERAAGSAALGSASGGRCRRCTGPRPVRPAAVGPDRGAVHAQRGVPPALGNAQTSSSTAPA